MKEEIHLVFPKEYMESVVDSLEQEDYIVTNKDFDFGTFYHWMTSDEPVNAKIALVVDTIEDDIPIEVKALEYVEKLTEIRLARPNLRLIINLPSSFKHLISMQKKLLPLSIYDIYFEENFSVQDILEWLETPKSLADMKSLIVDEHHSKEEFMQDDLKFKEESQNERKSEEDIHYEYDDDDDENEKSLSSRINHVFGDKIRDLKRFKESFSIDVNLPKRASVKTVEKHIITSQQSVAFISLSRGAGSTFHCLNYASYLREKGLNIGVYEQPVHTDGRSYLADVFDTYKDEKDQSISVPHFVIDRKPIMLENTFDYHEIGIYATDYSKGYIEEFKSDHFIRYLNIGKHTVKLMDFGYVPTHWFNNVSFIDVLNMFDHLVIVTDLLPISFIPNYERLSFFQALKNENPQTRMHFLLNKYHQTVPKKELKQLNLLDAHRCPPLPYNDIFESLFRKRIPYDISRNIQKELNVTYLGLFEDMEIQIETNYKNRKSISHLLKKSKS